MIPSSTVSPAWMAPCLAAGEGPGGSVVHIAVVKGTFPCMGIVWVVSVAGGVKGAGEASAHPGEVMESRDVVKAGNVV
jgi:hypothetical protein